MKEVSIFIEMNYNYCASYKKSLTVDLIYDTLLSIQ